MNITLKNYDPQNPDHVEMTLKWLKAIAAIQRTVPYVLKGLTDTYIDLNDLDPADPLTVAPETGSMMVYGKTTRTFLETMLLLIQRDGKTTLESVATHMGISLDTARAYLRNAGRTAAAHKMPLPVVPTWNHESGYNEYTLPSSGT